MGVTSGAAGRLRSGSQGGQIIALSVAGQVSGSMGLRGGVIGHREYSTSMSRPAAGRRHGRHRFGVCHRCGWKAFVSRVGREDHLRIGTGRAFGRLCDDCYDTLLDRAIGSRGRRDSSRRSIPPPADRSRPPSSLITDGPLFA